MDDLSYFLLLGFVLLCHLIQTRTLNQIRSRQWDIVSRLQAINVIVTGMALGKSADEIAAMFERIDRHVKEQLKFDEIAARESKPWWHKPPSQWRGNHVDRNAAD